MSDALKDDGLQLHQDVKFQRWEWFVQRIGWAFLTAALIAGLSGALGNGPLSAAHLSSSDGLMQLKYQRYLRHRDPTTLHIDVESNAAVGDELRLALNRSYLRDVEITRLDSAREIHGLERRDQIKYAVLECDGGISIISKRDGPRK